MKADPNSVLDYGVDWSEWLADGETITASTWTVPEGVEQATPAPSISDGITTIWLTGGTANRRYWIANHITTSAGRQDERTFPYDVTNR